MGAHLENGCGQVLVFPSQLAVETRWLLATRQFNVVYEYVFHQKYSGL